MTVSVLLWGNLHNPYVWVVLLLTLVYGAVGLYDDYLKVTKQSAEGFRGLVEHDQRLLLGYACMFFKMAANALVLGASNASDLITSTEPSWARLVSDDFSATRRTFLFTFMR